MGIVSLINTDKLFWLGRYSERVYTTIRLFGESFPWIFPISTVPQRIMWNGICLIRRILILYIPT